MNEKTDLQWIQIAGFLGLASILCYFGAAFLPIPDFALMLLAFSFGPLLCISYVGVYRFMARHKDSLVLQIAVLCGIIAGVLVTMMLVVQIGNNMIRAEKIAEVVGESGKHTIDQIWRSVDILQFLIDIVWDIFICLSVIFLGIAMWKHPLFGKIWGGLGIISGFFLLAFNLYSFPYPPDSAGSIDLGPIVALWMMGVYTRLIFLRKKV